MHQRFRSVVLLVLLTLFSPLSLLGQFDCVAASAQNPDEQAACNEQKPGEKKPNEPQAPELKKPVGTVERHVMRHLVDDQRAIWTSPLHARNDAKWLLPIAGVAAAMFSTDKWASRRLSGERRFAVSHDISNLGSDGVNYGIAGATYMAGKFLANRRAQEAGLLGLESALYTSEVVRVLKIATNRRRPNEGGDAHFWNGGKSFPSGHAGHSWAIATVLAHQYSNRPLVKYGAYTWATAVSISRLTGREHYPSDVLIGGTLGYLVARYVVRHHGRPPRKP